MRGGKESVHGLGVGLEVTADATLLVLEGTHRNSGLYRCQLQRTCFSSRLVLSKTATADDGDRCLYGRRPCRNGNVGQLLDAYGCRMHVAPAC